MSKPSPAREKTNQVIELYHAGNGCKRIASTLDISPRIAREILIEQGVYQPGTLNTAKHRSARLKNRKLVNDQRGARARLKTIHTAIMREYRVERWHLQSAEWTTNKLKKANILPKHPDNGKFKRRYHADPSFRLKTIFRHRISQTLKGKRKSNTALRLIGCDIRTAQQHIESQFVKGMNWANHGVGRGKWNIDHITPCAAFDLADPYQQRACFHYRNLRPMWSIANIRKSDTITPRNAQSFLPL